jgi:pSer/pThr/pTyr-binding forkhead associated (FHA) protein
MTDSELRSVHLEGLSRRDQFRLARDLMRAACGQQTLAGGTPAVRPLSPSDPGDSPTRTPPVLPGTEYFLRDGEHVHKLVVGVNSVGRLPDNSVVIRDEHVSRRHCAIVVHHDGRAEVHDIASKNGTILNGKKIAGPSRLSSGDEITMCGRSVIFFAGPSRDSVGPEPSLAASRSSHDPSNPTIDRRR